MSAIASRYKQLANPLKTERLVELGLLLLCVLFLLQLLFGAVAVLLPPAPDVVYPTEDSLAVTRVAVSALPGAEQRDEIRRRPLFWITRQPLEPVPDVERTAATDVEEAKAGNVTGIKLAGVFGAGDSAGIIVISKGKKHRVMVGEKIDGWTLESLKPTRAILSSRGKEAVLELERGKLVVTAAAAEPPPAAAQPAKIRKPNAKKQDKGSDTLTLGRG